MLLLLAGAIFTFLIIGGIFEWFNKQFPREKSKGYMTLKDCNIPNLEKDSEKKILRYIRQVSVSVIKLWWSTLDEQTKSKLSPQVLEAFIKKVNKKESAHSRWIGETLRVE